MEKDLKILIYAIIIMVVGWKLLSTAQVIWLEYLKNRYADKELHRKLKLRKLECLETKEKELKEKERDLEERETKLKEKERVLEERETKLKEKEEGLGAKEKIDSVLEFYKKIVTGSLCKSDDTDKIDITKLETIIAIWKKLQ